jgi:DNA-binding GntR family transcriptional regulator
VLDDPTRFRITASELDSRGLYNIIAQDYQLDVFNGEQTIAAVLASREFAEVFQTSPDSPLLVTEIFGHTTTGQAAVYAVVWYDSRNFLFRQLIAR